MILSAMFVIIPSGLLGYLLTSFAMYPDPVPLLVGLSTVLVTGGALLFFNTSLDVKLADIEITLAKEET